MVRLVFRHARGVGRPRPEGRAAPPPAQRQGDLPARAARPGLVARRPADAALRRGHGMGAGLAQEGRLQHAPQAHQGRARPVLLPLRPPRNPHLAGHALGLQPGLAEPARGRRRADPALHQPRAARARAAADDRPALQPPEHRHVGDPQRGLGPVRDPRARPLGAGASTPAAGSTPPRAGSTRT